MRAVILVASVALLVLGATALAADQDQGEQVYKRWCVHCHSPGRGNPGTQSLQTKYKNEKPAVLLERTDMTPEFVAFSVRQGVMSMPPFRKTEITDTELAALSKWLASGGGKR
jgi:mono/diheme cytochrome c family protein